MTKRAVFLNSLSGIALFAASTAIAFVMSPIMVHSLGNRRYGIWELITTLIGYLGVLELGVGSALVRFVADAQSRNDRDALMKIFNTGLVGLSAIGMCGFFVVLIGMSLPGRIFGIDSKDLAMAKPVVFIFGINLAIYLVRVALSAYLLGMQAHRVLNGIVLVVSLVMAVVTYHILTTGIPSPLFWMAMVGVCGTIAQVVLLSVWIIVIDRNIRIAPSLFNMETMRTLFGFGFKSATILGSLALVDRMVSVVIAYTSGVAEIAYFILPNRLVNYTGSLVSQAGFPLTPYFADLAGKGDLGAVRKTWIQTSRILQVATLAAPVALAILGGPLLKVWIGAQYAVRGKWILYFLCTGLFVQGIVANRDRLLISLNKHGRLAQVTSVLAIVAFSASIGLGYLWGINGVAAAIAGFVVSMCGFEITLTCRVVEMSVLEYFRTTALRLAGPLVAMAALLIALRYIAYPRGYGQIILYGLAGALVYLTATWFIALETGERKLVRVIVAGMGHKVALVLRPALARGRR